MQTLIELPLIMNIVHGEKIREIAAVIEQTFQNREDAYNFVCKQLDGARQCGGDFAKEFVKHAGVPFYDYTDAMNDFDTEAGIIMLTSTYGIFGLDPTRLAIANLYIVDLIMRKYKFGIYGEGL